MFCRLSNISLIVDIFSAVACFQTQAELWRAKNYYRRLVNCIPLPVGRVWDLHWQVTSDFKLPGQPEAHWHWRGQWVQATATQAAARACLENRNPSYSRKFDCCVARKTIFQVLTDQSGLLIDLKRLILIDCFLIIMLLSVQALMYVHPIQTVGPWKLNRILEFWEQKGLHHN